MTPAGLSVAFAAVAVLWLALWLVIGATFLIGLALLSDCAAVLLLAVSLADRGW